MVLNMKQMDYLKTKLESVISPMDLIAEQKTSPQKFLLIDVRNAPAQMKHDKITNSVEIPQKELATRLSEVPKDKEIIVYCWDVWCTLSTKAAIILLENGFKVKELYGGIAAWKTLKLPVTELK